MHTPASYISSVTDAAHTALPSKPLTTITLSDADNASALQFVKAKLHEAGIEIQFSHDEMEMINYLGGRASDVTTVCFFSPAICFTFKVQYAISIAHTQNACGTEARRCS